MTEVWLELRYGNISKSGALLCTIRDKALIRRAKAIILHDTEIKAKISELTDEVLGILDKADYEKLENLLAFLIPDEDKENDETD